MKWILLVVMAMFAGCSTKQVEYVQVPVEVKVPVMCQVDMPKKPVVTLNPAGLRELAIYTETLECALRSCRGESCNGIQ